MEIYNESIRDLLGNNSDDLKHDIKMTGSADKKDVMVTNLTTVMVTSEDQVSQSVCLYVLIDTDYTITLIKEKIIYDMYLCVFFLRALVNFTRTVIEQCP